MTLMNWKIDGVIRTNRDKFSSVLNLFTERDSSIEDYTVLVFEGDQRITFLRWEVEGQIILGVRK